MKLGFVNIMVFANDYPGLVQWYCDALFLTKAYETTEDYQYVELAHEGKVFLGLTPALEINHFPSKPRNNSTVLQIEVEEVDVFFQHIISFGGEIKFGPTMDEKTGLLYGGIADPEGNEIWVIQSKS